MTSIECIQFWTMVVTGAGVITALFMSVRQSNLMRQQMKVNLFADYTKRYQEITLNLPENINEEDFDLHKLKRDDLAIYNKTLRYMRVYFDLCSEEFHLKKNNRIDKSVWKNWSEGIISTFKQKAFIDAWEIADSSFYDEFAVWMQEEVLNRKTIKPE